ncbi:MAG: bifunctional rhamnulose-1-phosphate aldolase/short-chain dehydrogenase [Acidobacteriota bacterium]
MQNRWKDTEARKLRGLDELVYRSLLIGADPNLVLWGGGNTSCKLMEKDFRGREVKVLRVKGSGSDLRSVQADQFPGVRLDDVLPLRDREAMTDEEIVAFLAHCLVEPGSVRPSIETLLHAFVPFRHIDHSHADFVLSLTNNTDGVKHTKAVYGEEIIWIPYQRPGFALSKQVAQEVEKNPKARGCVLEKHGLITWAATARESYLTHIEFNTRAEEYLAERARGHRVFGPPEVTPLPPTERHRCAAVLLPLLRGTLQARRRTILRFEDSDDLLEFIGSKKGPDLSRVGAATPDHLMNTKGWPLVLPPPRLRDQDGPPELEEAYEREVREIVEAFSEEYREFYEKHSRGDLPMLEDAPRVVLVRGVGMITLGPDAQAARVAADVYRHTIKIMAGAQAISSYSSMSPREAFDAEYWPLELYKLTLRPPERELSRRVALVTGAAGGIGAAIAGRLAAEGAHVVLADLDETRATRLAGEICAQSGPGRAIGLRMDVTREDEVRACVERAVLEYGGLDIVVNNAGVAHVSPVETLEKADWERCMAINATGHFLVSREAIRVLRRQQLGGSLIFVTSKNVLGPGQNFSAYSASKAAQAQLARVLALEVAEMGVRVNMLSPDAVFKDSGLWSEQLRQERARTHGIAADQIEEFYRKRNLLRAQVRPEDVADSALFLASDRSSRTTGCILTVDGGLREAFPR